MQYKVFHAVKDADKINEFLQSHDQNIPENGGLRVVGDHVHILFTDETEEKQILNGVVTSLKTTIAQYKVQLAAAHAAELFYRERALEAGKGKDKLFTDLVMNESNKKRDLLKQIDATKKTLAEVLAGDLDLG